MNTVTSANNGNVGGMIDKITFSISRAKALAAIGASADMEDYQGQVIANYFDTVLNLLVEAEEACDVLAENLWHDEQQPCNA